MNPNDPTPAPVPTPRTDAQCVLCNHGEVRVPADFARQLETELAKAEARLAKVNRRDSFDLQGINRIVADQTAKLQSELAALRRDRERLNKLAGMVWDTRWASHDDDYQHMVGIAAEIRSGNFDGIDAAMQQEARP